MITRTFKLCLNAGTGSAPYINVSQYDEGETWLFELYSETGERYIPTTGAIVGVKSDGHGIANTGTVDSEGRVVIAETQQMTASAGRAIYELSIDGLTHGTANFIVAVERKPTDDAVMSDSDLSLIQEAVDAAETIEDLIEGHDPDEVIADAVDAWLGAHPEATTTVEDGAITSAKLNDSVKTGVFEDMTVGTSLAVMNDEGVTDNLAYKFRQTGGDAVRELDEIVGGTIAWNQLADNSQAPASRNGLTITDGEDGFTVDGTATASTDATGWFKLTGSNAEYLAASGHKVLVSLIVVSGTVTSSTSAQNPVYFNLGGNTGSVYIGTPRIVVPTLSSTSKSALHVNNGTIISNAKFRLQVFDLTAMFGATVADAIYAMEQSSAGSGVAYFRSMFPNAYYAYNSGELVSVEGLSSHDTVGFNQWNEEWEVGSINTNTGADVSYNNAIRTKGYIHVFPNTDYYIKASANMTLLFYDDNKSYISPLAISANSVRTTPPNCSYMRFLMVGVTTYNNDICINISSSENGTYKPYQKHTYPLDGTLTLRGVPKWNNGLYFDGDIYRHDGSVQRRYGVVDLGSLIWTYDSTYSRFNTLLNDSKTASDPRITPMVCAKYTVISDGRTIGNVPDKSIYHGTNKDLSIHDSAYTDAATFKTAMSGVYLVYEKATPTAETADPYQQYQICDGKGTEEYVSTTVTPVGHSTFYPVDIVAKVNKLPSDFSTLIAPTEATFKATRNYTAKQFLIINNQLYRITANIANGANIVPNTNVTAVTIADILTTLI